MAAPIPFFKDPNIAPTLPIYSAFRPLTPGSRQYGQKGGQDGGYGNGGDLLR